MHLTVVVDFACKSLSSSWSIYIKRDPVRDMIISIVVLHRCAVICRGVLLQFKPAGLCEGERAVFEGAGMQHKVSNYEAVRGGERDQLQYGDWNGGKG